MNGQDGWCTGGCGTQVKIDGQYIDGLMLRPTDEVEDGQPVALVTCQPCYDRWKAEQP